MLLPILLLAPGAPAGEAHPNDDKVVFFKHPDDAALAELVQATEDDFAAAAWTERAKGRAVCYRYPLWSVPFLVRLLTGETKSQPIQRINAILTLSRLLDPLAAKHLRIVARKDKSPEAQAFACLALGRQPGRESVRVLLDAPRKSSSQDVAVAALFALARLGGSEAEEALRAAVKGAASDRERKAALVGLSFFPTADAAKAARRMMGDSKTETRLRALLALCNMAFDPADERRAELTKLAEDRSEDARIRALAVLALARFTTWRRGGPFLADLLMDSEPSVQDAAARGLQHRGDPRTRKAILRKMGRTTEGNARLTARLLIALADIEAATASEEGRKFLVGRLASPTNAIQIYAAIALTRISDWRGYEEHLKRALSVMGSLRKRGGLTDAERSNFVRAAALLDPENAPETYPEAWVSPWGDEDLVLASLDRTLHEEFIDRTNWFVAEEMRANSVTDRPISRADRESGTPRVMDHGSRGLRDLKAWLAEAPYFTERQLPDRGYGE